MNASAPAAIAIWPTRLRNAEAVPQLNQPPCRWRIAALFRARAGFAHQPDIPPTVSLSKLMPSGSATCSMMPLNGARAPTPSSLPFMAATADLRAVIAAESSGLRGWITDQDSLIDVFSRFSVCIDFSFLAIRIYLRVRAEIASELDGTDRTKPPTDLAGVSLVHVEKVRHHRLHYGFTFVVRCY